MGADALEKSTENFSRFSGHIFRPFAKATLTAVGAVQTPTGTHISDKHEKTMAGYNNESKRLFAGNLAREVNERDLHNIFGRFGPIVHVAHRGKFGFIEYEYYDDARAGLSADGMMVFGQPMRVAYATSPGPRAGGRRGPRFPVLVENFPRSWTWRQLKDFARKVAPPAHADIDRDDQGPFGIVEYKSMDDAAAAVLSLDGSDVEGAPVSVRFERSIRDDGNDYIAQNNLTRDSFAVAADPVPPQHARGRSREPRLPSQRPGEDGGDRFSSAQRAGNDDDDVYRSGEGGRSRSRSRERDYGNVDHQAAQVELAAPAQQPVEDDAAPVDQDAAVVEEAAPVENGGEEVVAEAVEAVVEDVVEEEVVEEAVAEEVVAEEVVEEAVAEEVVAEDVVAEEVDYSKWLVKDLRAELTRRGLTSSGRKAELVERLSSIA